MPAISGNVGAVFNGGIISNKLAVNTADPLSSPIIGAQAPAGAENNGTYLIQLVSDIAALFDVDTDAGLRLRNTSGTGNALATVSDSSGYVQIASPGVGTGDAILVNTGVPLFRVLVGGAVVTAQHAAPADAALAAGEMAVWFDQTNGAAKLMVKAKSANGTVATGSLALT